MDAPIRSDRRIAMLPAVTLAAIVGILAAQVTPRGPITTGDALVWMAGSLALGAACGLIAGSRWLAILAPIAAIVAFELARLGTDGPTVDAVHLGSTYGLIALVVGRGVTYLLAVPAMMLGALLGVELAALRGRTSASHAGGLVWVASRARGRHTGLAIVVSRPATTAPIAGGEGLTNDSVAELVSVPIGGHDQVLLIRGRDRSDPCCCTLPRAGWDGHRSDAQRRRAGAGLRVVAWDQRGTGKSYAALDPVDTLTVDRMVADPSRSPTPAPAVRQGSHPIDGNSWGTLLGVLAVQARPDLYHAWIGTGHMVSPTATDVMFWEDTLAWAERTGDENLAATLRANGPPPYADILHYEVALSHEHDWNVYPEFNGDLEMPANLFVPEYDLMDRINGLRAFLDTFSVLYPQIQRIDLRVDAQRLEVPVYVVAGAHEARGRAVLSDEWFAALQAPSKERIVFERSGHRPSFEEPAAFAELMRRVRDETAAT